MMFITNKYTEDLIQRFPYFGKSNSVKETIQLYADGEKVNPYTILTGLTNYVANGLMQQNQHITQGDVGLRTKR